MISELIRPELSLIKWWSNYPGRLKPLEVLQKRIIIIICNAHRTASTASLFKQLNLLRFQDINILQIAQFMYKYHHCLLPTVFHDYFVLNSNVHKHYTRSSARNKYHLPSIKTNNRKFSIKFSGPTVWNNTSNRITSVASWTIFKEKLRKSIITNYWVCPACVACLLCILCDCISFSFFCELSTFHPCRCSHSVSEVVVFTEFYSFLLPFLYSNYIVFNYYYEHF